MAFDPNTFNATTFLNSFTGSQKHEITTVNSLQQVKEFIMGKGESYLLLDPNADLLYIKEMDTIGKVTIRVFSLTDVSEQYINNNTPVTISKSEYTKLINRLEQLEARNETSKPKQPEFDFKSNGTQETA